MSDAAWYPDPDGSPGLRWWDGARWSDRTWPPVAVTIPPAQVAAGWYEDPDDPTAVRWWNGLRWTERLARIELARGPASDIGRGRPTTIAVVAVSAVLVLGVALVVLS